VVATGVADLVPTALNADRRPEHRAAGITRMARAYDAAGDSPPPAPISRFEEVPVCLARI
jgi:hypothetical protein